MQLLWGLLPLCQEYWERQWALSAGEAAKPGGAQGAGNGLTEILFTHTAGAFPFSCTWADITELTHDDELWHHPQKHSLPEDGVLKWGHQAKHSSQYIAFHLSVLHCLWVGEVLQQHPSSPLGAHYPQVHTHTTTYIHTPIYAYTDPHFSSSL